MSKSKNQKRQRKYIFVVGGVMSGVGKGIASSSIALLLKARGLKVTALKIDPYINVDAGTMNPTEHGEVFVLKDGTETDQDMGNYERFLELSLTGENYMTTGSIYQDVIRRERNLEYKGKNVEVVPHIPLAVIDKIKKAADRADADVTLIEIGGTVGEYQNILFLEAVRMLKSELNGNVAVVLVSYLPVPGSIGEMKTKPTQYAARTLNSAGVFADVIIARSVVGVDEKRKEKIASFCNVKKENVISAPDVKSVYDVPVNFEKDGLSGKLCTILGLPVKGTADMRAWKQFVQKTKSVRKEVKIAVVGKYFSSGDFILSDVYISVLEAIKYSAYAAGAKPVITYLSSVDFEKGKRKLSELSTYDGILIPGGFGSTGVEGKIRVIEYARTKGIPYFGICYGMQLAVVEYARNILKLRGAHTAEIDTAAPHKVIDVMPEQKEKIAQSDLGGTMRLGEYQAVIQKDTHAAKAYRATHITERHRHRYEVNPEYVERLEAGGVVFSGKSPSRTLMEIMELSKKQHPFFVGVQFHPEFQARPLTPHPIFSAFVQASLKASLKSKVSGTLVRKKK